MAVPAVRPHSFNQSFTISQRRIVRLNRSSYSFIVQLSLDAHAHHGELVLLDALRDRCDPFIFPRHRGATPQNEHTKILTASAAVQSVRSSRSFAMSMNHHSRSCFSPALDLRGFFYCAVAGNDPAGFHTRQKRTPPKLAGDSLNMWPVLFFRLRGFIINRL